MNDKHVTYDKRRKRYIVRVQARATRKYVGSFRSAAAAIEARDAYLGTLPVRYVCDVCGKSCKRHVLWLLKVQKKQNGGGMRHGDYTASAGVGACCVMRINAINWKQRRSARAA